MVCVMRYARDSSEARGGRPYIGGPCQVQGGTTSGGARWCHVVTGGVSGDPAR